VQRIVHLKLSGNYPPEVREVAVIQDADGMRTVCCTLEFPQARLAFAVKVLPGEKRDPLGIGGSLARRLLSPAYANLRGELRKLIRSME